MTPKRISAIEFRGLAAGKPAAKPSKYRNRKVTIDGIVFHSVREGNRYGVLKLLERAGRIRALKLQPSYDLIVNGLLVCRYLADFEYEERHDPKEREIKPARPVETVEINIPVEGWRLVTEDAKGARTKDYIIKAKLFRALFGREVRET